MRIAEIAPVAVTVPPTRYGGTELIVSLLADGLARRGHDVTLFASGDSRTEATLAAPIPQATGIVMPDVLGDELYHEASAFLRHAEFDVLHDHTWFGPHFAPFVADSTSVVTTLHWPWSDDTARLHRVLGTRIARVAISESQRAANPDVSYAATIYNGVDLATLPLRLDKDDYLLFVGRTAKAKAPEVAVDVAQRAGRPLKMLIKCEEDHEREHWERAVVPKLRGDEEIIEGATNEAKAEYMGRAAAVLFPVRWAEPFGLVPVEAMACGTPVIAQPQGAVPEVVVDDVTGFLASSPEDMAAAVERLGSISPETCRRHVEERFSAETMVARYEALFERLVGDRSRR
jgi:glycosyltransferase involved in cell wall biosynthesis